MLPIIELKREDYPVAQELTEAYNEVLKKAKMGPQYEWLGAVSKHVPNLGMSLERSIEKPTSYDLYFRNVDYETINKDDEVRACYKLTANNDQALYKLLG